MSGEVEIRRAVSVADYLACQDAQRRAWGITDESYVVPMATLVGANLHGGLVLGAFTETGEALGLSFAFLGKVEGRPCLYSQLTGVVPGQQGNGLGGRLKHAQREFARIEGIPCLAWAFDPLQAGNARFNLDRLGATAGRFIPDMYGRRTDALNAGAATDRLIVEWSTDADGPRPAIADTSGLPRLIDVRERADGALGPVGHLEIPPDGPTALLEIPDDVASIRRNDPELADAWGLAVRRAFTEGFAAGYRAEGFVRDESTGLRRCSYVLRRPNLANARPG
jgi:predicted GNAT superfamily acetyltransferase